MIVQTISLSDFRNYTLQEVSLSPGVNIFYGDNAQGKTNLLEAICLCSTGRSYRGSKDKEMVRFKANEGHIRLTGTRLDVPYRIDLHLHKTGSKGIAVNGVPIRKTSELLGLLQIVFFSPEDLTVVKNGPSERRRLMDSELCLLDPVYLSDLSDFQHCLQQRNTLLRSSFEHPEVLDTLEIWDNQYVSFAKKIIERRTRFLAELAPVAGEIHTRISGGREELYLSYEPDTSAADLSQALFMAQERDRRTGTTSVGPHRDDIRFVVKQTLTGNKTDIRTYGSQGQQRTAALAVKMAEIEMVRRVTGDTPVLLLDDVLSELDRNRQIALLDGIRDIQTLITCTGLDDLMNFRFPLDRVFHVSQGMLSEVSGNADTPVDTTDDEKEAIDS